MHHLVYIFLTCYRPQRSWGKVIFSQASIILLTGAGASFGGLLPPGGASTRGVLPLGGCFLLGPGGDPTSPGRLLLRAVRILLECILADIDFAICQLIYKKSELKSCVLKFFDIVLFRILRPTSQGNVNIFPL